MSGLDVLAMEGKQENAPLSSSSPRAPPYLKDLSAAMAMKRSWSVDSFSNMGAVKTCVCSPTKHAGSFRCRLHRMNSAIGVRDEGALPLPSHATTRLSK